MPKWNGTEVEAMILPLLEVLLETQIVPQTIVHRLVHLITLTDLEEESVNTNTEKNRINQFSPHLMIPCTVVSYLQEK